MKALGKMYGVTLVELMTTLSAVAVTLTLGVPTFNNLQGAIQRGQATAELITSLTLARSEAARRGTSVTVCASRAGTQCDTGDALSWPSGWMVFTNADEDRVVDSGVDEILQVAHFEHTLFTLGAQGAIASGIDFRGSGYPKVVGTFRYCDDKEYRELALSYIGRVDITDYGPGCP
jgi:type IV fimbrial biogenesis protein FimT